MEKLQLKLNARVMLTYNIDNADFLVNGRRGTILDFLFHNEQIKCVIICFDDEMCGKDKRAKFLETNPNVANKYPNGTPIWKLEFQYSC